MYRFTHEAVAAVPTQDQKDHQSSAVPAEISLGSLTMFSAVLFMNEFRKVGMDSVDVAKTCNMSEWRRRLYRGSVTAADEDDIMDQPPKPVSHSGQIYATTSTPDETSSDKESFNAFLFVYHRPSLAKTIPATEASGNNTKTPSLSPQAQDLITSKGATHIWLCGSDPEQRRHHHMSSLLTRVEKDVADWRTSGEGSGVLCVHTIPQAFPAMVQFLVKNGFQGGERIIGGENGKVMYWKEVA